MPSRITFTTKRFGKAGERWGVGGKIPGNRIAQRGPEISVKCSYRLWSSWSIVKRTKCEVNNYSVVSFWKNWLAKHRLHRVFVSYEMKWGIYLYWTHLIRPSTGTVTCMHATRAIGTEILQWFLASNSQAIPSLIAIKKYTWVCPSAWESIGTEGVCLYLAFRHSSLVISVFISGDLKSQRGFFYVNGMTLSAKIMDIFLWQLSTVMPVKDFPE
jgi:hypothetical protein